MNTPYTYITTDGNGDDPRSGVVKASGIGEAGQLAYRQAEADDRLCVAVYETEFSAAVLQAVT